jgi:quercetin dioxygenase-like cupin family protein
MRAGDNDFRIHADFTLLCKDLPKAQERFERDHGFRLEVIFPADKPRVAVLSAYGIRLRLEQIVAWEPDAQDIGPSPFLQRFDERSFGDGRAAMQYRDLIPGRLGGNYIASHIRIPNGGPVPDYVHHHQIRFQLIYCYRGWVRLVYEDQGPPFVMHAGDCVLQPPHIRHRVLDCSDGMEVIEVACPAEHETLVEHTIELPTNMVMPSRDFDGQVFVHHRAEHASWQSAAMDGFAARDIGIAAATKGIASAVVFRAAGKSEYSRIIGTSELCFNFVLAGSAVFNEQNERLQNGDSFVIPDGGSATLHAISADFQILQVTAPAP